MPDSTPGSNDLQRLRANVNAQIAQAQRSEDPDGPPDPELQAYEITLRNLRHAVTVMEEYEAGLGNVPGGAVAG